MAAEAGRGHGHEQRIQNGFLSRLNRCLEEQIKIFMGTRGTVQPTRGSPPCRALPAPGDAERERVVPAAAGEV